MVPMVVVFPKLTLHTHCFSESCECMDIEVTKV